MSDRMEGDIYFAGACQFKNVVVNDGSITNAKIATAAAIAASKLVHQHRIGYSQANSAAATETRVIYTCYGATGTIKSFKAGSIAAAIGDSTVTLDLKKNGTTVLSAVITLDNANTARVVEAATLSVTTLVAGDVLEVVVTATIGTGTLPTGLFATLTVEEDAA